MQHKTTLAIHWPAHYRRVCRPFVYRPAATQDIGAESFVVHDPTTTQRKRNDATRRRDDKLVSIVAVARVKFIMPQ